MLALSTAWLSATVDDGLVLLDRIRGLERLEVIELDARLSPAMLEVMLMVVRAKELRVASLHAPCPVPVEVDRLAADRELQLNHPDRDERARALAAAAASIDLAAELEAPVVTIHLGRVELTGEIGKLRALFDDDRIDTEEAAAVRAELLERRAAAAAPYLDAARFSLEALLEGARRRGIWLALENRPVFYEMPDPEELEVLFTEFAGSRLRFCYDAGHAAVQETLGWTTQRALLEAHREVLCCVNLHDARGYRNKLIDERRQTDYGLLRQFVTPATPCVIEVEGVEDEQLLEYVDFLEGQGFSLR
ncbi:MAG: TIM barrel protein [Candidatus Tectomicrobia bacterium]|nr:TIM barrel protein [Candidatus Tectomicrobia bacterium]